MQMKIVISTWSVAAVLTVMVVDLTTVSAQNRPPAPVAVAPVIQKEVAAGQTFVATVMPLKRAVVGSAVDGRVTELVVHEGERVGAGKPLAHLLTSTIKLELAAAEAELELREESLKELKNGSRPFEIDQARAKMLGAKADMEYSQTQLRRVEKLRDSNALSQEEYDLVKSQAAQTEQAYYELKAAYELTEEGPRPERIAQARAQVAVANAVAERIRDRIKKYTVISRFDGYVVAEHVDEGTWVKSGDPVMDVVALDQVEVQAFVVEEQATHVKRGMSVRVEVPAFPDQIFTGTVDAIVPEADRRARTFPVKIRLDNVITDDGPLLKAGMYARVELPVGSEQKALMVPKDALVLGGRSPVIYVVDADENGKGTVQPLPVELGIALPNLIQVRGDVTPGQLIVVEGNERLRPGQEVMVVRKVDPGSSDADPKNAKETADASN